MPASPRYTPDTAITELGPEFYDPVRAAEFPEHTLRYRDDVAAEAVGLHTLADGEWLDHFARFRPLPDNLAEPLALRYHGHQFHTYNPDLGDGRGFLFAQARDPQGRLLDLGTKGSGTTPYSRGGDGRLTLLGGVREVLAARYLQHLGVSTSRALSLVETGEELVRGDEPSPTRSSVLVRLSHSHIRIGTFQRLFFHNETSNLAKLVAYCQRHFYPKTETVPDFLQAVVAACADTTAAWTAAGFVHGVLNTDNINITGESFDYGPYRFLPHLDPAFTAAYFDQTGLYAFGRQPEAMVWNLAQLAQALSPLTEADALTAALQSFAPAYRDRLGHHALRRLHLARIDPEADAQTVAALFRWLESTRAGWPEAWHALAGGLAQVPPGSDIAQHLHGEAWDALEARLRLHTPLGEVSEAEPPATLLYDGIGELWAPIRDHDDWSAFSRKLESFQRLDTGRASH